MIRRIYCIKYYLIYEENTRFTTKRIHRTQKHLSSSVFANTVISTKRCEKKIIFIFLSIKNIIVNTLQGARDNRLQLCAVND